MQSDSKFLVMGCAYGYDVEHVWVFVESLRRYFQGPVILLVSGDSPRFRGYLRGRQITPIYFDSARWMVGHIHISRFVRYLEILRGLDQRFERVFLTDVLDVVFQGHPFDAAPSGELLLFLEDQRVTIGQSATNSKFVRRMYDDATLERIKDRVVSCAGTTMGSHESIVDYLKRMAAEMQPEKLIKLGDTEGHDQGVHNVLLYGGTLANTRTVPNGEHVYTLASVADADLSIGPDGMVRGPDGRACPIIHQYTYKREILTHVTKREGLTIQIL